MAIEAFQLEVIDAIVRSRRGIVCLGYPDLLSNGYPGVKSSKDGDAFEAWHNWSGRVLDTEDFFSRYGVGITYLDHAIIRGPETVCDLNTAELPRDIGLLIDPGTSEHIFNVGHLMRQIAQSICIGGYVMHTNPMNQANHGFWNFSPTAYVDFYEANGFEIVEMKAMLGSVQDRQLMNIGRDVRLKRFNAPVNSSLFVLARKVKDVAFNWPVQAKYRANPMLKGAA